MRLGQPLASFGKQASQTVALWDAELSVGSNWKGDAAATFTQAARGALSAEGVLTIFFEIL